MTTLAEALGIGSPESDYERAKFWRGPKGSDYYPVPIDPQNELKCTPNDRDETMNFDSVNNPSHYTAGRKFEPVDVITDWDLDFCLGNVVKYLSRAGRKDTTKIVEDLKKARFYLDYHIKLLESN